MDFRSRNSSCLSEVERKCLHETKSYSDLFLGNRTTCEPVTRYMLILIHTFVLKRIAGRALTCRLEVISSLLASVVS